MYREVRRDLITAIDRADMERSGTRKLFHQHGYREFFGQDYYYSASESQGSSRSTGVAAAAACTP